MLKSRKPKAIALSEPLQVFIKMHKYISKEDETILTIAKVFKCVKVINRYAIDTYRIDFFPKIQTNN